MSQDDICLFSLWFYLLYIRGGSCKEELGLAAYRPVTLGTRTRDGGRTCCCPCSNIVQWSNFGLYFSSTFWPIGALHWTHYCIYSCIMPPPWIINNFKEPAYSSTLLNIFYPLHGYTLKIQQTFKVLLLAWRLCFCLCLISEYCKTFYSPL